jgi:uncharacterized membrane protein (GlpM family)
VADWQTVLIKALAGGALVMAFALLGEVLKPKRFAGLFGAAPAVAIAGLIVVLATKGARDAHQNTIGMLAGSAGMVAYAATTVRLLRSGRGLAAPIGGLVAWFLPTAAVAAFLL